jgi:hypothetical protein
MSLAPVLCPGLHAASKNSEMKESGLAENYGAYLRNWDKYIQRPATLQQCNDRD